MGNASGLISQSSILGTQYNRSTGTVSIANVIQSDDIINYCLFCVFMIHFTINLFIINVVSVISSLTVKDNVHLMVGLRHAF